VVHDVERIGHDLETKTPGHPEGPAQMQVEAEVTGANFPTCGLLSLSSAVNGTATPPPINTATAQVTLNVNGLA
jgi:hypothetical protein